MLITEEHESVGHFVSAIFIKRSTIVQEQHIRENVSTFMRLQGELLEENSEQSWVLIIGGELKGVFADYGAAFISAQENFPRQEMLIRRLQQEEVTVPFVCSGL